MPIAACRALASAPGSFRTWEPGVEAPPSRLALALILIAVHWNREGCLASKHWQNLTQRHQPLLNTCFASCYCMYNVGQSSSIFKISQFLFSHMDRAYEIYKSLHHMKISRSMVLITVLNVCVCVHALQAPALVYAVQVQH